MNKKKELAIHEKDTGSSEVQVAQLTDKIENLSKHIKNNKKDTDWNKINLWLDEWQPQAIIVGVTQQADGSASPIENEIKKFIRNLREKKIPIHIIDEENSSIEAKRIVKAKRQAGVIKKQKKEIIDSISAAIIAERWLNES